jgi:hypothetical protein
MKNDNAGKPGASCTFQHREPFIARRWVRITLKPANAVVWVEFKQREESDVERKIVAYAEARRRAKMPQGRVPWLWRPTPRKWRDPRPRFQREASSLLLAEARSLFVDEEEPFD